MGLVGLALAALNLALLASSVDAGCYKRSETQIPPVIKSPQPHEYLKLSDIPQNWDWRNVNGTNFASVPRNQHVPHYCGACWAFAATSSLSDRLKIARQNQWPEINLAPQVLLNCDTADDGCHGGDPNTAHAFINKNGIPHETCAPYTATGHDTGNTCTAMDVCKNCSPDTDKCFAEPQFNKWFVNEYGAVSGEQQMMAEIYARGPIVCGVDVTQGFLNYAGGIYHDPSSDTEQDHAIAIVGFGVDDNGTKYWIGRNSWGTYWGEDGWFRIMRGINNLGIEESCSWAVPDAEPKPSGPKADAPEEPAERRVVHKTCRPDRNAWAQGQVVTEPLPHTYLSVDALPAAWDWRNVSGVNYVTWTRNQHIPQYCGSCWAFGTTSAVSDRIRIKRKTLGSEINLAPQVLLNFQDAGSCGGGDPSAALAFMHDKGLPDETCQPYQALDGDASALGLCDSCHSNATNFTPGSCDPVTKFAVYKLGDYGSVSGATKMKAELYARGPISCGISVTDKFEAYTGGIYSEASLFPMINHELSVVGWGVDQTTGTEFWIGRNSWGEYWGESGFFRIEMHKNNLAIETDCSWGVPLV